jgi:carboxypeptidase D
VEQACVSAETWTDYSEIGPTFATLEATYPDLCKRHDLGLSFEGTRHLWAIQISDNVLVEEDEPGFKYISTMHGDEIVGTKMCMKLVDYLLTNYGSDPQATNIIDEVELWIVPLMNPDGYDRSPRTRYNLQGIDLNRNFPDYGEPDLPDGRATETQVIMNWDAQHTFTASANFHCGVMVVNYPFDNEDTGSRYSPDDDLFIYISEQYSQHNLPMWNGDWYHGITNGADWYMIWGGMQDWNYHFRGCNEVTIEISNSDQPPASEISQFWNDNRAAMMAYIETCLIGVRGVVLDGDTGLPLAATVTVVGRDHEIYTDPEVGDYHRMLLPGTYDLAFETAGYPAHTETGVVVTPGAATVQHVVFGGTPAQVVSPNGGEELPPGEPATVTWTGNPVNEFHVQYCDNYGTTVTTSDDFESGVLGPDYATGGDHGWYVTNLTFHSPSQSARAGNIDHTEQSWLKRTVGGGEVSFWYRVSSEEFWDFFRFYVDGQEELAVSGNVSWTYYSTTLSPGPHELEWHYSKDDTRSVGYDTVFIDDLVVETDATDWTDIVALTDPGETSTQWTPVDPGSEYKVRVRAHYGYGLYGSWDESDATFTVGAMSPDGDYDEDGDVDVYDFGALQVCFGLAASGQCGDAFELVVDGVIDLDDFAVFQPLLTGP